jgi:hypothetical protein
MLREDRPGVRPVTGETPLQSAQPRDVGAVILAIGVVLVLFILSLTLGSPLR